MLSFLFISEIILFHVFYELNGGHKHLILSKDDFYSIILQLSLLRLIFVILEMFF